MEKCHTLKRVHKKILYIINPIAGTGSSNQLKKIIERTTHAAGIPFECITSNANANYSAVKIKIKEERFTDVVIAGGDGTVSQVVSALRDTAIQFGIIPVGSGNGLARAAKIPMDPQKAIELIFKETGKPTDGFSVNGQFACMLSGLGFDATVAHSFARQSTRGLFTYAKEVINNFGGASPYLFELSVEGYTLSLQAYMISIANANQYGNNFTIAPFAKLNDGLLDIFIVLKQSKISMLWQTLKQLLGCNPITQTGIHAPASKIIHWQTASLTIQNREGAALHIDGDPAPLQNELMIRVLPQAFRLIRNNN